MAVVVVMAFWHSVLVPVCGTHMNRDIPGNTIITKNDNAVHQHGESIGTAYYNLLVMTAEDILICWLT